MLKLSMLVLVLSSIAAPLAVAAESKIDISSPVDGAKLDAKAQNKLDYNIMPCCAGSRRGGLHSI